MDSPEKIACGVAAVILSVAMVEGKIEHSLSAHDPQKRTAILTAFQDIIHELRDRAGMLEAGDEGL